MKIKDRVLENHGPCESLALSIVQIRLATTELRVDNKTQIDNVVGGRLPGGGREVDNSPGSLCARASELEGVHFYVDVPVAFRCHFNDKASAFVMTRESCAPIHVPLAPLAACVRAYCAPEHVTKFSKSAAARNGGDYAEAPHTKTMSVWRPPPFLALVLRRFLVTDRGRKRKLHGRVEFPVDDLDFSEFTERFRRRQRRDKRRRKAKEDRFRNVATASSIQQECSEGSEDDPDEDLHVLPLYNLVSVVNHFGGLKHSHYTCAAHSTAQHGGSDLGFSLVFQSV